MTDSLAETTPKDPSVQLRAKGFQISADFPLPRPVYFNEAFQLSGLTNDDFRARQELWENATEGLLSLIDNRSHTLHLTDDSQGFRERDFSGYIEKFKRWKTQVRKYEDAIDAQTMLSDGSNQKEVEDFKREMAQAAIKEGLITPEDCIKISIVLPKETTAPPEK